MASYLCMDFPVVFGGPLDRRGRERPVQADVQVGRAVALVYQGVRYTGAVTHVHGPTFCVTMQQVLPLGSMSHTVDVAGKAGGLLVQAL